MIGAILLFKAQNKSRVKFNEITCRPEIEHVSLATIESKADGFIYCRILLEGLTEISEWNDIGMMALEKLLNRLAFRYGVAIEPPVLISGETIDRSAGGEPIISQVVTSRIHLWSGTEECVVVAPSNAEQIFNLEISESEVEINLYAYAMNVSEPITRFLALYYILLCLCNDLQERADAKIKEISSGTPFTISPKNKKPESVFTRLRNEIAHRRDGTTLSKTGDEIKARLPIFSQIVKEAIRREDATRCSKKGKESPFKDWGSAANAFEWA